MIGDKSSMDILFIAVFWPKCILEKNRRHLLPIFSLSLDTNPPSTIAFSDTTNNSPSTDTALRLSQNRFPALGKCCVCCSVIVCPIGLTRLS